MGGESGSCEGQRGSGAAEGMWCNEQGETHVQTKRCNLSSKVVQARRKLGHGTGKEARVLPKRCTATSKVAQLEQVRREV